MNLLTSLLMVLLLVVVALTRVGTLLTLVVLPLPPVVVRWPRLFGLTAEEGGRCVDNFPILDRGPGVGYGRIDPAVDCDLPHLCTHRQQRVHGDQLPEIAVQL